ncbi:GIN domain-containing protein [Leeuwenhoekiella sp. NPDC079379]|uniref:GIN domain-containing protein n=1 Tax=Leeuwenhoekiella sp. NPDC079379 TaxID=3364122 RepID=UPI0037C5EBFB
MKFKLLILAVTTILTSCSAQNKIKGDKDVMSIVGKLESGINTVEIGEGIELELAQSPNNSYILTTDRNLVSVIDFKVTDSVLVIKPNMRITNAKELKVYLKLDNPQHIILKKDAEFKSPGLLEVPDFTLIAYDASRFEFKLNSDKTMFNLMDNAGGDCRLNAKNFTLKMTDRTDLKGDYNTTESTFTLDENAEFSPRGKTSTLQLTSSGKSNYKGSRFESKDGYVTLSGRTSTEVYASDNLKVFAQDKASVKVYGKGDIKTEALKDDASIEKK